MNEEVLLTIIVPTFNRARCLDLLLQELGRQLHGLQDRVGVIVGDNASTDGTPAVTRSFKTLFPTADIVRHDSNEGPDENFCRCLDRVRSKYFWIIGDDDLPKEGVVSKLLDLLQRENPDLVYMRSEWVSSITSARQGTQVGSLQISKRSRMEFARKVHVWFTFISGTVVNRVTLQGALKQQTIRRFTGSRLVQLGWVFPVLGAGERFVEVHDPCMLATQDNTGGYAVLTVFGANFPRIVRQVFGAGSELAELLISRASVLYLPQLIWASRGGARQRFSEENPWRVLREQLGMTWAYWVLLLPIGKGPIPVAWSIRAVWTLGMRVWNRLERRSGVPA